jgi:transposase
MARPTGSAPVIDARRHRALRLPDEGYSLGEAGRMTGSAANSVMRWRNAHSEGGEQAPKVRMAPVRPATRSDRQRRQIIKLLMRGAVANGFDTELWITSRVARVIQKVFQIRFHRSHVACFLHDLGFSCQKPERCALERDEQRIERWKRRDWPRLKKTMRGSVTTSTSPTNPACRRKSSLHCRVGSIPDGI